MWSVKCEVWSVKFEVWSAKSAVCSVRCGVSREGHGRDRLSLNYRSFMFGKLPPPACPGLCYYRLYIIYIYRYINIFYIICTYYMYNNKGDTRFAWPQSLSFDPPELVRYIHRKSWASRIPGLVNIQKTMENHHFKWENSL